MALFQIVDTFLSNFQLNFMLYIVLFLFLIDSTFHLAGYIAMFINQILYGKKFFFFFSLVYGITFDIIKLMNFINKRIFESNNPKFLGSCGEQFFNFL
jgi:uncharacterized Tic20 family protein